MRNTLCILFNSAALVLFVAAPFSSSKASVPSDFATKEQRTALRTVAHSMCSPARRPPLGVPSVEVQMYTQMLTDAESDSAAIRVTSLAMDTALNRLGEGEAAESWNLLCSILATRLRILGPAAPGTITVLNNFAYSLRKQGRVVEARKILQLLVPIVTKYPPEGGELTRQVLSNLGTSLAVQGYYEQGEATLRRSLTYARPDTDTTTTRTNIAYTLEARAKWRDAELLHRQLATERHGLELAATLNNLGANLISQDRAQEAEPVIRKGLSIREGELPDGHLNIGYSLATLVRCLLEQGKASQARPFAERLLALRQSALGSTHSETSEAHKLLAEVQMEAGAREAALNSARAALEASSLVAARETADLDDEAKVSARRQTSNAAFTFVRAAWVVEGKSVAYKTGGAPALLKEAFLAVQRISTSTTLEAQLSAGARSSAAIEGSQNLAENFEHELRERAQVDALLATAAARGSDLVRLQRKVVELDQKHAATTARLRAAFPHYFDLIRPEPVSLESVAGWLGEDEVLFVITPGVDRKRGFVWALTRANVVWSELPMDSENLNDAINGFRSLLDPGNTAEVPERSGKGHGWRYGYELYNSIFGSPQAMELARSKSRWILAPQGVLMSLPFNALLLEPPEEGLDPFPASAKLRAMRWLGLEKTLALLPSVGSLRVLRAGAVRPTASQPFFGIGDPFFPNSKAGRLREIKLARGVTAADIETLRQLDSLPGTRVEIEALARLLKAAPASVLLGKNANEPELWKRIAASQLLDARVVAFATHGLMGGELSGAMREPALVLSPPTTASVIDDGLLTASEITRMKLRADWVLLSACNSAAGSREGSEGLSGLAKSFLYAGARSLLISHWRVSDAVAPRISGRAIELAQTTALGASVTKASAVRQAMAEVMRDTAADDDELATFAHPRAWAVFAFVGVD